MVGVGNCVFNIGTIILSKNDKILSVGLLCLKKKSHLCIVYYRNNNNQIKQ